MAEYDEMAPPALVARVRARASEGKRLYLELKNGQTATVDANQPFEFMEGSVVLVRQEDNYIEAAPESVWPDESFVGVVRLKKDDVTVVDARGQWKMLHTNSDLSYAEGNTIEASDAAGIIRVLSNDPIRFVDLPTVDKDAIATFRHDRSGSGESFNDFGGLEAVVARARELIEAPLKHKEALNRIGARPIKGVLFTGPPGTGKTMLARIIANETDSAFFEIGGPEIFSKWYGQSEEILRRLFEAAKAETSAIIFFDEIDSVASQREEEAHEASRRVVAQLLTLMDGFESGDNVIVIAATNRPQDIDGALRRPGRFDWEISFPIPTLNDRRLILEKWATRLHTSGELPHEWVAKHALGWSGAELSAIWSEAALLSAADKRDVILAEDYVAGFQRVALQRRRLAVVTRMREFA